MESEENKRGEVIQFKEAQSRLKNVSTFTGTV